MENAASVNSQIVKLHFDGVWLLKAALTRQVVRQNDCPAREVGASAAVPSMVLNQATLGERGAVLLADDDVIEYPHIDKLERVL